MSTPDEIKAAIERARIRQSLERASARIGLEADVGTIERGAEAGAFDTSWRQAIADTRQRLGPDAQAIISKSQAPQAYADSMKSARMIQREAEKTSPEYSQRIKTALANAAIRVANAGTTGVQKVINFIDTPDRIARDLEMAVGEGRAPHPIDSTFNDNGAGDQEKWLAQRRGYLGGAVGKAADMVGQAAAQIPSVQLTNMALAGVTHLLNKSDSPVAKVASSVAQATAPTSSRLGDMAISMVQPSSFLSLGVGATSKEAALQALRMAKMAKLDATAATRLANSFQKLYELRGATPKFEASARKLLNNAGVTDDVIAHVVGQHAEFAGKEGVKFAGVNLSRAVSKTTGLPEQIVRRNIENAARTLARNLNRKLLPPGFADVPFHERTGLRREAARIKHSAISGVHDAIQEFVNTVAPKAGGIEPQRMQELVREFSDPSMTYNHAKKAWELSKPLPAVTPQEQAFLTEWQSFMKGFAAKHGIKPVAHPVTGMYIPRQFETARGMLTNEKGFIKSEFPAWNANPLRSRGGRAPKRVLDPTTGKRVTAKGFVIDPTTGSPIVWRYGKLMGKPRNFRNFGTPIGDAVSRYRVAQDPFDIMSRHIPAVEKMKARQRFRTYLADNFAAPAGARVGKADRFIKYANSQGKRVWVPRELEQSGMQVFNGMHVPLLDSALNHFKTVTLLPFPRFHKNNIIEDTMKSVAAGMKDPRSYERMVRVMHDGTPASEVLFYTPGGRAITVGKVREILKSEGMQHSLTAGAHDLSPVHMGPDAVRQMNLAADKATGMSLPRRMARAAIRNPGRTAGEALKDVTTLGLRRPGRQVAEAWEKFSKGALMIDLMAQGAPQAQAATTVSRFLFDHSVQSTAQQIARRVAPFAGYTMRTVGLAPRLLKNPRVMLLPSRLQLLNQSRDDHADEAPKSMSSRFPTYAADAQERAAIQEQMRMAGQLTNGQLGGEINPGYGMAVGLRGHPVEGLGQTVDALSGDPTGLLQMLGGAAGPAFELLAQRDLLTGREALRPTTAMQQFNYGTPGVPESMMAERGHIAPLAKYAPGMVGGPMLQTALNMWGRAHGAPQAIAGAAYPFAEDQALRDALAIRGLITGTPVSLTTPMTGPNDRTRSPEVQSTRELGKERVKEIRKERRKKKQ